MNGTCPFSYRQNQKPMILCKQMQKDPYCLCQKMCNISRKYELTEAANKCKWRLKNNSI